MYIWTLRGRDRTSTGLNSKGTVTPSCDRTGALSGLINNRKKDKTQGELIQNDLICVTRKLTVSSQNAHVVLTETLLGSCCNLKGSCCNLLGSYCILNTFPRDSTELPLSCGWLQWALTALPVHVQHVFCIHEKNDELRTPIYSFSNIN